MSVPSSASSARSAPARAGHAVAETGTQRVKRGMADMLKGGVIMDVVTPDHAKIAEDAGAVAVMALELAASGLLDPATSLLLAAVAHDARLALNGPELPQSDLTRALRAVFGQPGFRASLNGVDGAEELLTELESAAHQVFLARKFYNDAVAATRDARRRPLVRLLRLSGGAPLPEFFEIEDSLVGTGEAGQGADIPHLTG